ncbi:GGDEF domain-containing protein (plasmid) [Comamonadaceae bacterium OTU4NAUVB1]|nr:GGDEF domain-containing protein [Comamonadaceae bacterium OTU4NAUVB1]
MWEASPGRWKTLLLGHDRRQRISIAMTLPAMAVYAVSCLAQWVWAQQGHVSEAAAALLVAVIAACQLLLYVVLRSGWTRGLPDPALTLQQMVFAMLCLGAGYALNHQVRGTLLMVVALVLVFGAFTLSPGQCRTLGWLAFGVLGTVMIAGTTLDPVRFPPTIEWLNVVFVAITLPLIGQLTGRLSRMRLSLHRQRKELRAALETVRSLATRDPLTGLPNRRHVLETVEAWRSATPQRPAPLCVAVIDLDHFKAVNDRFGHPFGDVVLTNFSRAALAVMPEGDTLSRWGGEEFVLLMPDTSQAAAMEKLQKLQAHVRDPATWRGCAQGQVNFSAGLTAQRVEESFEQTLTRADRGLYEAKRAGRDRCVGV